MNKPTLENIKNLAFLSNESYKTAVHEVKEGKEKEQMSFNQPLKNPATKASFEVIDQIESANGFSATVFKDTSTNEYVIAFRGTDHIQDMNHNSAVVFNNTGEQFSQAFAFANEQIAKIQAQNPDAKISITGTSLGGNLAQYVAYETGHEAITFNALGAKYSILKSGNFDHQKFKENSKNVINIINKSDVVPKLKEQYGDSFEIAGPSLTIEPFLIVAKKGPLVASLIIGYINIRHNHSIETLSSTINKMDEGRFNELMNKPSNHDNAIFDNPIVHNTVDIVHNTVDIVHNTVDYYKNATLDSLINDLKYIGETIIDNIHNTVDYYKNATLDSLINDLKYIGEMIYDKASGIINISLYQPYDPIALDLNANGKIDTLSLENGVFFDHNGDEIAFKSSWISGGDGILARDIDGDKEINSGAELFGNFTKLKNGELAKNGAEALKDLDDNNDGLFDESDKAFNEILVWQDFNSNGKAESDELKSLSEHGIKSINLEFLDDNTALDKDNKQILIGSFKISSSVNSVKISA